MPDGRDPFPEWFRVLITALEEAVIFPFYFWRMASNYLEQYVRQRERTAELVRFCEKMVAAFDRGELPDDVRGLIDY